jgi:RNA-directed DNA polymerase
MEKGMKESSIEGQASHDGPESGAGPRKGVGEAWTGVRAGRDIEPRNHIERGADAVHVSGRQHDQARYRECLVDPARSQTPRMRGIFMRENREVPWLPALDGEAGRGGKAEAKSQR